MEQPVNTNTMRAGQLTEKITIQFEEVTQDELGGKVVSMSNRYVDIACHVRVEGGNEADDSDERQVEGKLKAQFTTRFAAGVKMTDRILWSGGWWDITAMVPIGRREWLRMSAEWSDNQADAMSFSEEGALQIIPDTGGLTLPQVVAEYQYNTTGQTFPALADYYIAQNEVAPQIAYPNIIHMDDIDDVGVETWGPNGYQGMLSSGVLSPGPAPSNILHIAEVDTVADPQYLKTLVNNNEFGNKHRFTYDDGTEATEVYSGVASTVDNHAVLAGYTGSNPRYVIDHYTGLGWYVSAFAAGGTATSVEWYDARGLYDYYTDMQDWVDKPSTFTYGGFTDWRRPTGPEWTFGLGSVDWSSYMTGNNQSDRDIYFPPLNQYSRGFGSILMLLGPADISNESLTADFNWFVPASQTNGGLLTGIAKGTLDTRFADGTNSNYSPILCRRHYDNR